MLIFAFVALIVLGITVGIFFLLIEIVSKIDFSNIESAEKRAGRKGEEFASSIIREVLKDDTLLTNVRIEVDGKRTELDNVVVNNRGIFIIEVKNYTGQLIGDEEDDEWIKNKMTSAGNFYQKTVRNPIKQVRRQVYLTSRFLKQYGINVWVEGYVFFVEMNSPVESEYVLNTRADINNAIHYGTNNKMVKSTTE